MPHGFLKIRLQPDAEARWRAAADTNGSTLSTWLRGVAELAAAGGTDPAEVRDALVKLRTDLNRGAGNNLNQIARALNATPGSETALRYEVVLERAVGELAEIRVSLQSALDSLGRRQRPSPRGRTNKAVHGVTG